MSETYSFSSYNITLFVSRATTNTLREKIWIIPCRDIDHLQIMARFTQCLEGCVFWLQIFHFRKESSNEANISIDLAIVQLGNFGDEVVQK
jgi:hypothetical protein